MTWKLISYTEAKLHFALVIWTYLIKLYSPVSVSMIIARNGTGTPIKHWQRSISTQWCEHRSPWDAVCGQHFGLKCSRRGSDRRDIYFKPAYNQGTGISEKTWYDVISPLFIIPMKITNGLFMSELCNGQSLDNSRGRDDNQEKCPPNKIPIDQIWGLARKRLKAKLPGWTKRELADCCMDRWHYECVRKRKQTWYRCTEERHSMNQLGWTSFAERNPVLNKGKPKWLKKLKPSA